MKFFVAIVLLPSLALAGNLVENGQSRYVITMEDRHNATFQTAANELQDYLKDVSGADIAIVDRLPTKDTPCIVIGRPLEPVGPDGICIQTRGNDLFIGGAGPRGAIYAAEAFLEDYVGVRWWTSTETYIPKRPTIELPKIDIAYTPKLRYREAYYFDAMHDHAEFAVHCKLNGRHNQIPRELGGAYRIIGWVHTFYAMLPPDKYFAQHPEWYSEIKGKRITTNAQLCLSNEEMRREMTRVALEQIAKDPDAGIISISQNDCLNPCGCEKCAAIVKEEGSESGPLIRFVNAIAEEVAKKYPNFLVETLAYQHTRHPPLKVHPGKNVLVRLCSIEADFSHPLDAPSNKPFYDDLRGWSAISPNLFIWNYVTDFGNLLLPHPNMTSLGSDLKLFADNNVIGVFEQGDSENRAGDFLQLRVWLLAHLMWDPTRDQGKLMAEFMTGYYGPAAPHLAKYLELVNAPSKNPEYHKGCISGDASYWNAENADKAAKIFDDALAAVGDDKIFRPRVERERLAVRHLQIIRHGATKPEAESFKKDAETFGVKNLSEGGPFKPYVDGILKSAK